MMTPISLAMRSRSENKPPDERQPKTTGIAPPDSMARKSAGFWGFSRVRIESGALVRQPAPTGGGSRAWSANARAPGDFRSSAAFLAPRQRDRDAGRSLL